MVLDAIQKCRQDVTDSDIVKAIGNYLRYAPDRKGGGGRKQDSQDSQDSQD